MLLCVLAEDVIVHEQTHGKVLVYANSIIVVHEIHMMPQTQVFFLSAHLPKLIHVHEDRP